MLNKNFRFFLGKGVLDGWMDDFDIKGKIDKILKTRENKN